MSPTSADVATLVGSYLDHLAAGRSVASFTGTTGGDFTAALAYLRAFGVPTSIDSALIALLTSFLSYVDAGGAITTLPNMPTPTPTPTPVPTPLTWVGSDADKVTIGFDGNRNPVQFTSNLCVGTARLIEVSRGNGWILGRYGDGTMIETQRGTDASVSYGPNQGVHFGFATRAVPTTLSVEARPTRSPASQGPPTPIRPGWRPRAWGTLKSGTQAVDFAAMKVGLDLALAYNGIDFAIGTAGGAAAPAIALGTNGRFDSSPIVPTTLATMTGNGCTAAACFLYLQGALGGNGASHAAVTYNFCTRPGGGGGSQVQGVAAFGRN